MPELPEVEIIRRGLSRHILSETIEDVDIRLPRQIHFPSAPEFRAQIRGCTIKEVQRRGKYLLLALTRSMTLVIHLRMTGRIVYAPDGEVRDRYARVVFLLASGAVLVFGDIRTFGALYLLPRHDLYRITGLASLGPEPLSDAFTAEGLRQKAQGRRTFVKAFLLQQENIAGIGNIYADEALFVAGIHPARRVDTLTVEEWSRLHQAVRQVLWEGIADGGTTFRDYQNADGGQGHHQEHLHVYEREGTACDVCGTEIENIKLSGRGTRFCPICQK